MFITQLIHTIKNGMRNKKISLKTYNITSEKNSANMPDLNLVVVR